MQSFCAINREQLDFSYCCKGCLARWSYASWALMANHLELHMIKPSAFSFASEARKAMIFYGQQAALPTNEVAHNVANDQIKGYSILQ